MLNARCNSTTTLHPFMTSRESVLPLWSATAQTRRTHPDTSVPELFVLLHGMLFTHIQRDNFGPTLARFIERLEIEGAEEREWVMMAAINISAVLEYGRPGGILKRTGGVGGRETTTAAGMRVMVKRGLIDEEGMDVDETASPALSEATSTIEYPLPFKLALELTFSMFTHVLRNPTRKALQFAKSTLNPYMTVLLTFLATVLKHPATLAILERSVPWEEMARFLGNVPRNVMAAQGLGLTKGKSSPLKAKWVMLTGGCAPPLSEDWCLRGMEWVGRRVYERGFWKSGEERRAEIEVLNKSEGLLWMVSEKGRGIGKSRVRSWPRFSGGKKRIISREGKRRSGGWGRDGRTN